MLPQEVAAQRQDQDPVPGIQRCCKPPVGHMQHALEVAVNDLDLLEPAVKVNVDVAVGTSAAKARQRTGLEGVVARTEESAKNFGFVGALEIYFEIETVAIAAEGWPRLVVSAELPLRLHIGLLVEAAVEQHTGLLVPGAHRSSPKPCRQTDRERLNWQALVQVLESLVAASLLRTYRKHPH